MVTKRWIAEKRWMRGWIVFLVIFVLIAGNFTMVFAEEGRTVRVGFFDLTGFTVRSDNELRTGYNIDYLSKIAEKTQWKYEFVDAHSWPEALKLLEEKKIDLLAPSQMTSERQAHFGFSAYPIGTEYGSILTLDTTEDLNFEDFEKFSQIKIGCVETLVFKDAFFQYAQQNGFTPDVAYYKDTNALLSALNVGEVDAVVANLMIKKPNMKILGKFSPAAFYYMYQKDDFELGQELNGALAQIKIEDPGFENELVEKYYPTYNESPFSKAEIEYIKNAEPITVGYVTERDPVAYMDKKTGEAKGITKGVLDRISDISGLKFNYVALPAGEISYDFLRENHIQLLICVEYNMINATSPGLRLSTPYLSSTKVVVQKKNGAFDPDARLKMALPAGSQTLQQAVAAVYPNFDIVWYDTTEECMDAVKSGKADILLQNQYVVQRYLAKPKYESLCIVPTAGLPDLLSFSPVIYQTKGEADQMLGDERLISIINKSIRKMEDAEFADIIINETVSRPYKFTVGDFAYRYRYFLLAISLVLLAVAVAVAETIRLRRRNFEIITASENKLRNIANNINGGVVVLIPNEGFHISYANEGFLSLIQYTKQEYENGQGQNYVTYVHPEDMDALNGMIDRDASAEEQVSVRLRIKRKDGVFIPTLLRGTLAVSEHGRKELYCVIVDISDEVAMLEKLELERKRYELLMEKSEEIIFDVDLQTKEVMISERFKKRFGWTLPKHMNGQTSEEMLEELIESWHIHGEDKEAFIHSAKITLRTGADSECVARVLKNDLTSRWCRIVHCVMEYNGHKAFIVGKVIDIDEEVKEKEQLLQKSQMDTLTGLYNKEAFAREAQRYIDENPTKNSAVIFIDLDNFKQVNDLLGHMIGDEALKDAAKKLQIIFSNFDLLSRFGGDEFCVMVKDIPLHTLHDKLKWLVDKMRDTYSSEELSVSVSSSVGVACVPADGTKVAELLACADRALYSAKENGKNQYVMYNEDIKAEGYRDR